MKKMRQGLLSGLIVLLFLITANAFAQSSVHNYAEGFRWNGSQLQFNPSLFYGPSQQNVWYNAYFSNTGHVVVTYHDSAGDIPHTDINASTVIDAIGSGPGGGGNSDGSGGYTPSPSPDSSGSSIYMGREFGNSVGSNREVTDLVGEGREQDDEHIPVWEYHSTSTGSYWVRDGKQLSDDEAKKFEKEDKKRIIKGDGSPFKSRYNPPMEIGAWKLRFGLSSSYDEYRYKALRRLTGEDAYGRLWRTTARLHAVKERLVLSSSLSYEEFWGTGLMDSADYSALSLEFVPQYYLLRQSVDLIDLAAFLSLGGEHAWYDDSRLKDDQVDTWHYGAGFGAGRTFSFGDFWFAYLYQCHKNADGDDGVTGDGELGTHRLGLTYTTLLARQVPLQASIYYNHSSQLPKELDSDDFEGAVRVGWRSENWNLLLGYRQLFDSSDIRNWGVDCKFTYLW